MKISILTPSYNSGQYIERAIQSVLRQSYANYEHIIVDGASTDQTLEILDKYSHLKWLSEPDAGQSDAMNKAFRLSTGELILYLNADDEIEEGAFVTVIHYFKQQLNTKFLVGNIRIVTPFQTIYRTPSVRYRDVLQYWKDLFPANPVSYYYRREVQESIGPFPIDEHFTMDLWFLWKAYRRFSVKRVDYILGTFHLDGKNKTSQSDVLTNQFNVTIKHLKEENRFMLPWFWLKLQQKEGVPLSRVFLSFFLNSLRYLRRLSVSKR